MAAPDLARIGPPPEPYPGAGDALPGDMPPVYYPADDEPPGPLPGDLPEPVYYDEVEQRPTEDGPGATGPPVLAGDVFPLLYTADPYAPPVLAPGVWPKELPIPDMSSYGWVTDFGLQQSPEPGPSFQRRTAFGQPTQLTFAFRFSTQQLGLFILFMQGYGWSFFEIELAIAGARIRNPGKDCIKAHVRFTANPDTTMIGINLWNVSIPGEIRSMLTPGGN